MHSIWNENYLLKGKLKRPSFVRDWKNGLKHLVYALKRRKLASLVCVILVIADLLLSHFGFEKLALVALFIEQFVLMFIACPVILSAWADMKDSKVMVYETNLTLLAEKMFVLSMIYSILTVLLSFLFIVPGIWYATVFSMSLITLCVDNSKLFQSFSISKSMVAGNFYDVFRYLILWAIALGMIAIVVFYGPYLALYDSIPESMSFYFEFGIFFFADLTFVFLQLSFLPPMVYLFAYLTDKKLHKK